MEERGGLFTFHCLDGRHTTFRSANLKAVRRKVCDNQTGFNETVKGRFLFSVTELADLRARRPVFLRSRFMYNTFRLDCFRRLWWGCGFSRLRSFDNPQGVGQVLLAFRQDCFLAFDSFGVLNRRRERLELLTDSG